MSTPRIKDHLDDALVLFKGLDYSAPSTQTGLNQWDWNGYYPVVVDGRIVDIRAADDTQYAIAADESHMVPRPADSKPVALYDKSCGQGLW